MTPAALAALPRALAPAAARALATARPDLPWPLATADVDPVDVYMVARRAALPAADVLAALTPLRSTAPGRHVLGLVAAALPPPPPRAVRSADGSTLLCPPRVHLLDPEGRVRTELLPAAAPPAPTRRRRPRARPDERVVVQVQRPNPRKPGTLSHRIYELYEEGLTCDELVARGVRRVDVRWDVRRGHVLLASPRSPEARAARSRRSS